jgi:hypothetical protein
MENDSVLKWLPISVAFLALCMLALLVPLAIQEWHSYKTKNVSQTSVSMPNAPVVHSRVWSIKKPNVQCENRTPNTTTTVYGSSMLPTIWPGDNVHMVDYDGTRPLTEGSIVYVLDNESFMMHRVQAVYEDYVITMGDNNAKPDERRIPFTSVSYVVCSIEQK